MKKKNIAGIIVIAILLIGIVAALVIYKKEQVIPEKTETGEQNIQQRKVWCWHLQEHSTEWVLQELHWNLPHI